METFSIVSMYLYTVHVDIDYVHVQHTRTNGKPYVHMYSMHTCMNTCQMRNTAPQAMNNPQAQMLVTQCITQLSAISDLISCTWVAGRVGVTRYLTLVPLSLSSSLPPSPLHPPTTAFHSAPTLARVLANTENNLMSVGWRKYAGRMR